jgi:hypothetical protein
MKKPARQLLMKMKVCAGGTAMVSHERNTGPMLQSPRCGAKTRSGKPCMSPAVRGARRCRMHGGANSGAPRGNQNALKHGRYTNEAFEERQQLRNLIRQSRALNKTISDAKKP